MSPTLTLRVVYINPNPSGGNIYFIDDVAYWVTKNRELHIWRHNHDHLKHAPDIIFAVGQWVCAELPDTDGADSTDYDSRPEPPRRDRHHVGEKDYARDAYKQDNANSRTTEGVRPAARRHAQSGTRRPEGRRQSDLNDLAYSTPEAIRRTQVASVEFAIDNRTVPWSEAHMRKLLEYERAVQEEFGPDAVDKLPWNRIPRAGDNEE